MFIKRNLLISSAVASSLMMSLADSSHAQHVHGVAQVGVVVEDKLLSVTLRAPLGDLVGFEHAPEDNQQVESIKATVELVANVGAMFRPTDGASCTVGSVEIDAPSYFVNNPSVRDADHEEHDDDHKHDDDHEHDHEEDHDDHDEHAAHEDHDDHDHDDEHEGESGSHADVSVTYVWECQNPAELDAVAILFTEHFERIEELNIDVLTAAGAQHIEADRQTGSISLTQ